jgi:alpha-L-rhamnosidase
MNLVPEAMRPVLMRKLVDNIRAHDWHLTTGFIGVGYLCPVLSEGGESEVAYRLLLSTSFPSWGYAIEHGATSMWERWDGWTQEQGFQTPAMNSFNHYAFGSVGEWLYRYVAGMDADPDQPGFAHVRIHPQISPALARVSATYQSVRGQIATAWRREGADLVLEVTIPANSWATVVLPYRASSDQVTEGGQALLAGEGIRRWHGEENTLTVDIGSGHYQFRCAGIFNARI